METAIKREEVSAREVTAVRKQAVLMKNRTRSSEERGGRIGRGREVYWTVSAGPRSQMGNRFLWPAATPAARNFAQCSLHWLASPAAATLWLLLARLFFPSNRSI